MPTRKPIRKPILPADDPIEDIRQVLGKIAIRLDEISGTLDHHLDSLVMVTRDLAHAVRKLPEEFVKSQQ
jgi:hypothetical protein